MLTDYASPATPVRGAALVTGTRCRWPRTVALDTFGVLDEAVDNCALCLLAWRASCCAMFDRVAGPPASAALPRTTWLPNVRLICGALAHWLSSPSAFLVLFSSANLNNLGTPHDVTAHSTTYFSLKPRILT